MLRIKQFLLPDTDVESFDFSLISSLKKASPSYEKGRKVKSTYIFNDELIVEKIFEDIIEKGIVKALKMTINWYNDKGEIGLVKTQIVKYFNKTEVKTLLKDRRNKSIDYLAAAAEGTPIEEYVNAIFKKYKNEVDLYIYHKTEDFKNALLNEKEEPFLTYLNIVVKAPDITVKDSILNEIT